MPPRAVFLTLLFAGCAAAPPAPAPPAAAPKEDPAIAQMVDGFAAVCTAKYGQTPEGAQCILDLVNRAFPAPEHSLMPPEMICNDTGGGIVVCR